MAHWTCATEAANACSELKEERVAFMSHPLLWNSLRTGPRAGGHSHKPDSLQQPIQQNKALMRALWDAPSPAAKANVYICTKPVPSRDSAGVCQATRGDSGARIPRCAEREPTCHFLSVQTLSRLILQWVCDGAPQWHKTIRQMFTPASRARAIKHTATASYFTTQNRN